MCRAAGWTVFLPREPGEVVRASVMGLKINLYVYQNTGRSLTVLPNMFRFVRL